MFRYWYVGGYPTYPIQRIGFRYRNFDSYREKTSAHYSGCSSGDLHQLIKWGRGSGDVVGRIGGGSIFPQCDSGRG